MFVTRDVGQLYQKSHLNSNSNFLQSPVMHTSCYKEPLILQKIGDIENSLLTFTFTFTFRHSPDRSARKERANEKQVHFHSHKVAELESHYKGSFKAILSIALAFA